MADQRTVTIALYADPTAAEQSVEALRAHGITAAVVAQPNPSAVLIIREAVSDRTRELLVEMGAQVVSGGAGN